MVKARGKVTRSTTPKADFVPMVEPGVEIAAWCPDPEAQQPPEQVHFIFHLFEDDPEIPPLVMRFKSPDSLGFFIEELARYRRHVWPDSEPVDVNAEFEK